MSRYYLELGSGPRPFEDGRGWVHNDFRVLPDIEIVADCFYLPSLRGGLSHWETGSYDCTPDWGNESCIMIRATHLLEHVSFLKTVDTLKDWMKLLIPRGTLYLEVPNLAGHIKAWQHDHKDDNLLVNYLYGDQDYKGNFHYAAFTEAILRQKLQEAGYENIHVQDIGMVLIATGEKPE